MSAMFLVITAFAGGLGSALRYLVDRTIRARVGTAYPWGTFIINVSGSLLLGVLTGAASSHVTEPWAGVVGIGLLGGYTTFSAASVETVRLLLRRRPGAGLAYGLGSIGVCVAAAHAGLIVGRL